MLRKIIRKPIIIKSNGLQLISSVIAIPIKGINNKKRGGKILFDIFKNNKTATLYKSITVLVA
ncbi:hypothetical protein N8Z72_06385, partial [Polaribacter sp.]|nr:hypothetical protein [Polaribacter sp.]